jgi:hypothetical protein
VGRLLALCDELDAMCEARLARGEAAERAAAASLQDLLRYRLVRLVRCMCCDSDGAAACRACRRLLRRPAQGWHAALLCRARAALPPRRGTRRPSAALA